MKKTKNYCEVSWYSKGWCVYGYVHGLPLVVLVLCVWPAQLRGQQSVVVTAPPASAGGRGRRKERKSACEQEGRSLSEGGRQEGGAPLPR